MSELLSFALFLASVLIYAWKAGRNTWWFAATLTVLGLFVVLNITLFASDYFTGAGINDAVLYTLTNSLTGAGVSKYILPGIGIVLGLTAVFGALGWILRRRRHHPHHFGYSLLALLLALGSVDASPAFRQITELVKSQSRDGDPDFAAYYKEGSIPCRLTGFQPPRNCWQKRRRVTSYLPTCACPTVRVSTCCGGCARKERCSRSLS